MSNYSSAAAAPALAPTCGTCGQPLAPVQAPPTAEPGQAVATPATSEKPKPFLPGTLLAGRYRIVSLAGRGGLSEVYRAEDLTLDQTVALKFLAGRLQAEPEALARFQREVRLARQIPHPNICRVFDIGEADGRSFITMEFVDGEDLHSLLRRIGRFAPDKALEVALQTCAGLTAAHAAGVLHRDLKPANVMLDDRGNVKITDFGLAALDGDTIHGLDSGTPGYMAPEQLAGKEVTARSDIYALGLLLHEMFTGRRALEPDKATGLGRPGRAVSVSQNLSGVDPWIAEIIQRCLDPDPAKRPPSAVHVAAALSRSGLNETVFAPGEFHASSAPLIDESARPRLAWKLLATTMLGFALLLILAPRSTGLGLALSPKSPDGSLDVIFTWLWCLALQSFLALLSMAYVLRSGSGLFSSSTGRHDRRSAE